MASSILATDPHTPPSSGAATPFYGWRFISRVGPDGEVTVESVPLTLEDVLHPQEDDCIPENSIHQAERTYLYDIAKSRESRLDRGLILSDCLIDWGVMGQRNTSPDISMFEGIQTRQPEPIGTFHVAPSGGHCLGAIELVSPDTRTNDVDAKVREYHQAQVPLYVIVDQKQDGGPRELKAYRYTAARYVLAPLDKDGCVLLDFLGVRLGLKDNRVVCYDASTGAELGNYAQVVQQARAEAEARQAAEKRVQELEAELRRLRGPIQS